MNSYQELANHAKNIRRNIVKMVTAANSGHPGGSLSGVEILTSLYFGEMNFGKDNFKDPNRRTRFSVDLCSFVRKRSDS